MQTETETIKRREILISEVTCHGTDEIKGCGLPHALNENGLCVFCARPAAELASRFSSRQVLAIVILTTAVVYLGVLAISNFLRGVK